MEKDQKKILKALSDKFNSKDHFGQLIGIKLIELRSGFARATIRITDDTININKMAHRGAIGSVADLACEAAGNSFGEQGVAIQNNLHFFAPGKSGDILDATAKVIRRFESIGVIEFEVRNQEGLLLAKGTQHLVYKESKQTSM